jgi:hypothetical protein
MRIDVTIDGRRMALVRCAAQRLHFASQEVRQDDSSYSLGDMVEVHRIFDGGKEVEHLQRNFSSEGVREVVLHPFQDSVDPARVFLVNHSFGVLQAIRPIRHQILIFREPRLELVWRLHLRFAVSRSNPGGRTVRSRVESLAD